MRLPVKHDGHAVKRLRSPQALRCAELAADRPSGALRRTGGARDLSVTGYNADAVRVNLRVRAGPVHVDEGVPIDLGYRYTVRPALDRSTLNINVNNGFVQSLRIPACGYVDVRSRPLFQSRDRRRRASSDLRAAVAAHAACSVAPASTTTIRKPANARAACWMTLMIDPNSTTCPASALHGAAGPGAPSPTAVFRSRAWRICRRRRLCSQRSQLRRLQLVP